MSWWIFMLSIEWCMWRKCWWMCVDWSNVGGFGFWWIVLFGVWCVCVMVMVWMWDGWCSLCVFILWNRGMLCMLLIIKVMVNLRVWRDMFLIWMLLLVIVLCFLILRGKFIRVCCFFYMVSFWVVLLLFLFIFGS